MSITEATDKPVSDVDRFVDKARAAAAIVSTIRSFEEAVDYAVDLGLKKELRRYAIDDSGVNLAGAVKTIAAPLLSGQEFDLLAAAAETHGLDCIGTGLRSHLAGVDIGLSYGDIGIAETGTVVVNCPDEQLRLATMICEYHVCILKRSAIVPDAYAAGQRLTEFMLDAPTYTAFITGPSRTADIERVLSIGVHGPLELHILILED
jgi:L-lactate dehydrogenase complex protein LldG